MDTIPCVFENGVFRPKSPVDLPESIDVDIITVAVGGHATGGHSPRLLEILSRRYNTGISDLAAKIDEHQP